MRDLAGILAVDGRIILSLRHRHDALSLQAANNAVGVSWTLLVLASG